MAREGGVDGGGLSPWSPSAAAASTPTATRTTIPAMGVSGQAKVREERFPAATTKYFFTKDFHGVSRPKRLAATKRNLSQLPSHRNNHYQNRTHNATLPRCARAR